jgi:uncharacterized membrane protein YozB (DUF420 family)
VATLAQGFFEVGRRPDHLSGTPRAGALDRWIYVITAASFVVLTLAGFIPDSLEKIAAVNAGERPPFPIILHIHAVLMGAFLLLLLAQTTLVATGRCAQHRQVGIAAFVLAPALVLVGFMLAPAMYHYAWNAAATAPPATSAQLHQKLLGRDNILLLQLRIGILFPLFLIIGLRARRGYAGLHKRMMILATAMALPAAIDRLSWLPTTLPASPLATDLYTLLAVSPMFAWDVIRNRSVHPAYLVWLAINLPFAIAVHGLWDAPWWHSLAPRLMGV